MALDIKITDETTHVRIIYNNDEAGDGASKQINIPKKTCLIALTKGGMVDIHGFGTPIQIDFDCVSVPSEITTGQLLIDAITPYFNS